MASAKVKIRFCQHNDGAAEICRQLKQEYPDLNIKLKDCLKQCKDCRTILFAAINKQKIAAESKELLVAAVRQAISELNN